MRLLLAIVLLCTSAFGQTYIRPFTSNSPWNTKIQQGATYLNSNMSAGPDWWYITVEYVTRQLNSGDPSRATYNKTGSWPGSDYCNATNQSTTLLWNSPLTDGFTIAAMGSGNGQAAFVEPNGVIREGPLVERCTSTGPAYFWAKGTGCLDNPPSPGEMLDYTIYSTGFLKRPTCNGASEVNSFGGLLRQGELVSPAGVFPQHALSITVANEFMYYNASTPTPGWRWPAWNDDSNSATEYLGTVPDLKIGSILTFSPDQTPATLSLRTELAKKMFWAMKYYGAMVSDTFPSVESIGFLTERDNGTSSAVQTEVFATHNIRLLNMFQSLGTWTSAESDFFNFDMPTMFDNCKVITNTSQYWPKGPPVGDGQTRLLNASFMNHQLESAKLVQPGGYKNTTRQ